MLNSDEWINEFKKFRRRNKMGQYYVYSGYVGPDNYDCSEGPVYTVNEFSSKEAVLAFRKEFEEGSDYDERSNVIFRVFEGIERKLKPLERVIEYDLV